MTDSLPNVDAADEDPSDEDSSSPDSSSPDSSSEALAVTDVTVEKAMLTQALGGWRGLFDSGIPSLTFVIVYLVDGQQLRPAVWSAVGVGALMALFRLYRKQSVQQVLSGFIGLAFSAWLASRTGQAQDFFLPGILINAAYGAAFLISILIRRPLVAYAVGAISGDVRSWISDRERRRAATAATWVWVVIFFGKVAIQLPLYWAGAVAALGITRVVLGYPLLALGGYLNFRLIRTASHSIDQ